MPLQQKVKTSTHILPYNSTHRMVMTGTLTKQSPLANTMILYVQGMTHLVFS